MNKVETYNRKNILSQIKWLIKMVRYLLGKENSGGDTGIQSIVAGDNISVDNTNPQNPVISATSTSETPTLLEVLTQDNDAEDKTIKFSYDDGKSETAEIGFLEFEGELGETYKMLAFGTPNDYVTPSGFYNRTIDGFFDVRVTGLGSKSLHILSNQNQSKGITSTQYFGANYDDNTYVQKKYVDDAISAIPTPEFVQITENGKTGWGLKYRADNPDNYGDIGNYAIDLGLSIDNSSTNGATGFFSIVSGGYINTASGRYSTVSGGYYNTANSFGEWVGGLFGTIPTGQNASTWVATDRLFNIGNGTNSNARSDAFTILKNGLATLPSVTNTLIDEEPTGKAVVTKEWVQDFYKTIPGYDEEATQTLKNINGVMTWVTEKVG